MRSLILAIVAACSGAPKIVPAPAPLPAPAPAAAPQPTGPFAEQNLGFEQLDGTRPKAWESRSGVHAAVTDQKHGGARSLRLEVTGGEGHAASTSFDAKPYLGKRVRVHGYIKTQGAGSAAIWLRADRGDAPLGFEGMEDRRVTGTAEWTQATVELDIPLEAERIVIGGMVGEKGIAWFDDLSIEVDTIKPPAQIVVEGTVVDFAGVPVADAYVTLIDSRRDIAKHVRSDGMGRFRFMMLEGTYGFSAHHANAVGGFVARHKLAASTNDLEIKLGETGGVTVKGRVKGKLAPNTVVQASLSEHDAGLFAIPVAANGTFEAVLPRGDQYLVSVIGGRASGRFDRKGDRVEAVLDNVDKTTRARPSKK
ncbi:MAG TPA: carboxypeptidase-like regulatory domain-containing protein [Kofleriaceae bacterium]